MKNLTLRPRHVNENNVVTFPGTADLVRTSLNFVPRGAGVKPDEMRARIRVLDALERGTPEDIVLVLEDTDAKTLQRCVDAVEWTQAMNRDILQFCDDIKSME